MEITRDYVQEESVNLIKEHENVLLKWGTGIGKTLAFLKMQEEIKPAKVYIIVAETAHIKNWKDEYIKHDKEALLENVEIFCYASLKKYANTEVDMICLDEGHHIMSDARLSYLDSIISSKIIILSATFKTGQIDILTRVIGPIKTHTVTLRSAIENNMLPEPTVYLIPLRFPEGMTSVNFTRGNSKKRVKLDCTYSNRNTYIFNKKDYENIDLTIHCTHRQKNTYLDDMIAFYKKRYFATRQIFFKNKWLQLGSERKRYLAESKTQYVQTLLNKVTDKRFICFTGSIEQANYLSSNTNVIHSKIKDSLSIINSFNNGIINHLFVVDMLREGQNLNNIEVGIIVQLDGDVGPYIQKMGRVMRAENPLIFVFYFKDSRDTEYLENILEEIKEDHIKYIDDLQNFNLN